MRPLRLSAVALAVVVAACGPAAPTRPDRIVVCTQSALDLLDGRTLAVVRRVAVGPGAGPHNATSLASGKRVLATTLHADGAADELIALDPRSDADPTRIPLEVAAGVAHVLADASEARAVITSAALGKLFVVDLATGARLPDLSLGRVRPHGLAFSPDQARLFVANLEGSVTPGSVTEVDVATGERVREVFLDSPALQVVATATAVFASLLDPPGVARVDRGSGAVARWSLPSGAKAPAQLLLTPDHQTLLVAEEGTLLAPGSRVFALEVASGSVTSTLRVGKGAHGLAVSPDGRWAFVTAKFDNTVAVIDLERRTVDQEAGTDRAPTGVAAWTAPGR